MCLSTLASLPPPPPPYHVTKYMAFAIMNHNCPNARDCHHIMPLPAFCGDSAYQGPSFSRSNTNKILYIDAHVWYDFTWISTTTFCQSWVADYSTGLESQFTVFIANLVSTKSCTLPVEWIPWMFYIATCSYTAKPIATPLMTLPSPWWTSLPSFRGPGNNSRLLSLAN